MQLIKRFGIAVSLKSILLALFFASSSFASIYATNYYVSNAGSNTNNGTSLATAFATIQKAHEVSLPGDIIWVADGTYNDDVVITRNGNSTATITYKAINKWGAKVINSFSDCFLVSASYIVVDGFDVVAPSTYGKGVGIRPNKNSVPTVFSHHVSVINNRAHDCGESGIAAQDADYITIENNVCFSNSWIMPFSGSGISIYGRFTFDNNPGYHYIVRGNISYLNDNGPATNKTDGNGIIIDDLRNTQTENHNGLAQDLIYTTHAVLVENNLCYANGGKGITMPWSNNITLRNNTVYGNNTRQDQGAWSGELNLPFCSNVTAINNICVGTLPLSSGIFAGAGTGIGITSNLNFYNNIAYSTLNSANAATSENVSISVCGVNGNLCNVNPLFANPGANFHLQSSSPAKNAGTAAYGISTLDLDGFARVQGSAVDIGCYETSATNVAVAGISFNPNAIIIPAATNNQLTAVVSPLNATNQLVSYSSSNPSAATVNSNTGIVTGVAIGTTTITGTTQDGTKTATCGVTVTRANTISIASAPTQVNATGPYTVNVNYGVGQNGLVKVLVIGPAPSYIYYGEGSFAVVTNQTGTNVPVSITPDIPLPSKNNYTFYATVSDNNQKEFTNTSVFFNVLPTLATGVAVTPSSKTIGLTSSLQLVANFTPSYTTNQNVTWVSSNPAVAPVNITTGQVAGIAPGIATITATTQDGSFTSTSNITVSSIFGGSVTGMATDSVVQVNLTSVGKTDWIHWGSAVNRKATGGSTISNYSLVGTTPATEYSDDSRPIIWTDGSPNANTSGDRSGLYIDGMDNGFSITVPAGTTTNTLYLYAGGWNTSGKLTATLSDSSSGDFIYTTPAAPDVFTANFKLSFRAKTNGQTLTVKWVVTDDIGNVTLQGAALENGVTVTNVAVTPGSASINIGSTRQLSTTFTPANASNKNVSWSSSNPAVASVNFNGLVTALSAGTAQITATTQDAGKTAISAITVTTGGSITGSVATNSTAVNLSTIGTSDWKHFRNDSRKASGAMTNSISNDSVIGSGLAFYTNDLRNMSWTGGTPTASSTNNKNGSYIAGTNNGFSFNVPAGTGTNTVYVYVGGWNSGGTLTAQLSDNSAPAYVNITSNTSGQYNKVYTITYNAASAGKSFNIKWVLSSGTGNVTIQAAALVGTAARPAIVSAQSFNNSILLYPNPVSRKGLLNLYDAANEINRVSITDILGRVRYVKSFRGSVQFNISDARLSPGTYFLNNKKEKGQKTYQFVVE